jgi:hypothetical protein
VAAPSEKKPHAPHTALNLDDTVHGYQFQLVDGQFSFYYHKIHETNPNMQYNYRLSLQLMNVNYSIDQCCGSGSARIRIIWPDPDPEFWMPDPADPDSDPGLQNWHLINLFSVEKYCE